MISLVIGFGIIVMGLYICIKGIASIPGPTIKLQKYLSKKNLANILFKKEEKTSHKRS